MNTSRKVQAVGSVHKEGGEGVQPFQDPYEQSLRSAQTARKVPKTGSEVLIRRGEGIQRSQHSYEHFPDCLGSVHKERGEVSGQTL